MHVHSVNIPQYNVFLNSQLPIVSALFYLHAAIIEANHWTAVSSYTKLAFVRRPEKGAGASRGKIRNKENISFVLCHVLWCLVTE